VTVEAVIAAAQVFVMVMLSYFFVGFQSDFVMFYFNIYVLAMASTALSVMLGCAVENPKLGQ
jgi:ABC-type multidrug transport system permease subunit